MYDTALTLHPAHLQISATNAVCNIACSVDQTSRRLLHPLLYPNNVRQSIGTPSIARSFGVRTINNDAAHSHDHGPDSELGLSGEAVSTSLTIHRDKRATTSHTAYMQHLFAQLSSTPI